MKVQLNFGVGTKLCVLLKDASAEWKLTIKSRSEPMFSSNNNAAPNTVLFEWAFTHTDNCGRIL